MIFLSAWGLRTLQQKGHRGQSANGANHSELSLHDKFTRTDYTRLLFQASVIRENTVTFLLPKRKSAILLCWDASEGHLKKKASETITFLHQITNPIPWKSPCGWSRDQHADKVILSSIKLPLGTECKAPAGYSGRGCSPNRSDNYPGNSRDAQSLMQVIWLQNKSLLC